jgi:hypothetical protein
VGVGCGSAIDVLQVRWGKVGFVSVVRPPAGERSKPEKEGTCNVVAHNFMRPPYSVPQVKNAVAHLWFSDSRSGKNVRNMRKEVANVPAKPGWHFEY